MKTIAMSRFTWFVVLQAIFVGVCWSFAHVPMYCVYTFYAFTLLYVNLLRWPTVDWLQGHLPQVIHDRISPLPFSEHDVHTYGDLHSSFRADALFTCNTRYNDTEQLADHIQNAFVLKSVVYIILVLALIVAGAAPDKKLSLTSVDIFKAAALFIILFMALLWDAALCFHQRSLNRHCHMYAVVTGTRHEPKRAASGVTASGRA